MKFNFKVITSVVAVICLGLSMTAVIAMDINSKKVPSDAEISAGSESIVPSDDTETITVEKEDVENVTSSSPDSDKQDKEEVPEVELTEEELAWKDSLMANVEVSLNIRQEANVESEVVGVLRKGDRATVIEIGSEWTKITSGKIEGYVNNAYCLYGTDALSFAKENCDTVAKSTTEGLRIREGASTDTEAVGRLEEGDVLLVDTSVASGEWIPVLYQGNTCYVNAAYVTVSMNIGEAITIDELIESEELKEEEERRKQEEAAMLEAIKNSQSNKAYAASVAEVDLLAALIYCEANIEPYEAQLAVGAVVMNRLERGTYGSTLADVIYQPEQFTPALDGKVNNALKQGLAGESCYRAAREALAGVDNTNGALYFNDWHEGLTGIMYGNMVFYHTWSR